MSRKNVLSKKEKRLFLSLVSLLAVLVIVTALTRSNGQISENTSSSMTNNPSNQTIGGIPADTTPAEPVFLTISRDQPTIDGTTGLPFWPAESTITTIHKTRVIPGQLQANAEQPLQGVTVILDPGHGGQDGGTVYPVQSSNPQIVEKEVVLVIAQKTREALEAQGATVLMTRETDEWLSLYKRVAWVGKQVLNWFAADLDSTNHITDALDPLMPLLDSVIDINSDRADNGGRGIFQGGGASHELRMLLDVQRQFSDVVFLSLHCNAFPNDPDCSGLQVYYQTSADVIETEKDYYVDPEKRAHYVYYDDDNRLKLANTVHDTVVEKIPELKYFGERSVLPGNYAVLREQNLNAVLVEMGFVTNQKDRQILTSDDYQSRLAEAFAEAVLRYYSE
ncbi:MAG: N-acetylmuramoyl-L-alanine amidase [Clostridiaceae bacterium]|nr:N-acetylmuramoyl-L-alanine amidase [Clostridiaceae bacterium]